MELAWGDFKTSASPLPPAAGSECWSPRTWGHRDRPCQQRKTHLRLREMNRLRAERPVRVLISKRAGQEVPVYGFMFMAIPGTNTGWVENGLRAAMKRRIWEC